MKKNNVVFIVGVVLMLAGVGLFASVFSVSDNPSCSVPFSGGVCSVQADVLPEGMEASSYVLTLGFSPVGGEVYSGFESLTPLQTIETEGLEDNDGRPDEKVLYHHSLYSLPESWGDVFKVEVEATTSASLQCNDDEESGDVNVRLYKITIPYNKDVIVTCDKGKSVQCPSDYLVREVSDGREVETDVRNADEFGRIGVAYCNKFKEDSDTKVLTKSFTPTTNVKDEIRFLSVVEYEFEDNPKASYDSVPAIRARYIPAEYVSDVAYGFGNRKAGILQGVQRSEITTIDLAREVNAFCDTSKTQSACGVNLTFKSSTGGVIEVLSIEKTLRNRVVSMDEIVDSGEDAELTEDDFGVVADPIVSEGERELLNTGSSDDGFDARGLVGVFMALLGGVLVYANR